MFSLSGPIIRSRLCQKYLRFSTKVRWTGGNTFIGFDDINPEIRMSAGSEPGMGPMKVLLVALGGCSSYDLVNILKKQRQVVESVVVEIDGKRSDQYPRPYISILMTFTITGKGLEQTKVDNALDLGINKYCGVHASLNCPVKWKTVLIESA